MKIILGICLILCAAYGAPLSAATLYKCKTDAGIVYADTPCGGNESKLATTAAPDGAASPPSQSVCAKEIAVHLQLPPPVEVLNVSKEKAVIIDFLHGRVMARPFKVRIRATPTSGAQVPVRNYTCYASEDERRILKVVEDAR
jgi:hypothetical protein